MGSISYTLIACLMSRQIMDCCIASLKSIAGFDLIKYYAQLPNFVGTAKYSFIMTL